MKNPQYILAKYVPDLGRMEPLNIGILVWNDRRLFARFLETKEVTFIDDVASYEDWVGRWSQMARSDREVADLSDVLNVQEDQYILVDSGFVPERVNNKDTPKLLDFLFGELVSRKSKPHHLRRAARTVLRERCDELLEESGAAALSDYLGARPVVGTVQGVELPLTITNYWGNGHPRAIMQQVSVATAAGWQNGFLAMQAMLNLVSKRNCAALIQGSDAQSRDGQIGKRALEELCPVIDVEDETALDRVAEVARQGLR
jgi:hypothetical protein